MKKLLLALALLLSFTLKAEVFIMSIPKSGTHMIQKALKILEVGDVPYWHPANEPHDMRSIPNFLKRHPNATIIYNIRDPRDTLVSFYYSFFQQPMQLQKKGLWGGELAFSAANFPRWEGMSHDERILACITGGPLCALQTHRCILGGLKALSTYQHLPQLHYFKYENLVGPQGGGDSRQKAEITRLCKVAGGNPAKIPEVMRALYGSSSTFNKGKIGRWRKELNAEHIRAFKTPEWSQCLRQWGYETRKHWR